MKIEISIHPTERHLYQIRFGDTILVLTPNEFHDFERGMSFVYTTDADIEIEVQRPLESNPK